MDYLVYLLYRAQTRTRDSARSNAPGYRERYTRGLLTIVATALYMPIYAILLGASSRFVFPASVHEQEKLVRSTLGNSFLIAVSLSVFSGFLVRAHYNVAKLKTLEAKYGADAVQLWVARLLLIPAIVLPPVALFATVFLLQYFMRW